MNIALLCIASDDYLKKYKKCIMSQEIYSKKNNYNYILNSDPTDIVHWKDWYWKKIHEAKKLLDNFDYLIIIDADCEVTSNAISIESVLDNNSIYYVLGISNRPNSGFFIIKNNLQGHKFLDNVLKKRKKEFPINLSSTKGENGHIIWDLIENKYNIKELPICWNCSQPEFIDQAYIIHYTNKMKPYYTEEEIL